MQIIYPKPILQQIVEAKTEANCNNQTIDRIILNKAEWKQACDEIKKIFEIDTDDDEVDHFSYYGVLVVNQEYTDD